MEDFIAEVRARYVEPLLGPTLDRIMAAMVDASVEVFQNNGTISTSALEHIVEPIQDYIADMPDSPEKAEVQTMADNLADGARKVFQAHGSLVVTPSGHLGE